MPTTLTVTSPIVNLLPGLEPAALGHRLADDGGIGAAVEVAPVAGEQRQLAGRPQLVPAACR